MRAKYIGGSGEKFTVGYIYLVEESLDEDGWFIITDDNEEPLWVQKDFIENYFSLL